MHAHIYTQIERGLCSYHSLGIILTHCVQPNPNLTSVHTISLNPARTSFSIRTHLWSPWGLLAQTFGQCLCHLVQKTHRHTFTCIHKSMQSVMHLKQWLTYLSYSAILRRRPDSKILLCKENYVCVDMHSVALYMSHSTLYQSTALITDQRGAPAIGIVAEDDTHNLYVGLWLVIMSD